MQHRFRAGGVQLEHYSATARAYLGPDDAAERRSAVEIARRVADHRGVGVGPVRAAREVVQYRLRAGGIQLEDYPVAGAAALPGGAVEIALRVPDQSRGWVPPMQSPEVVQHRLRTGSRQVVRYSAPQCAPAVSCGIVRPGVAPAVSSLNPSPNGDAPPAVVPYRLPAASRASPMVGYEPSAPPVKL